MSEPQRSMLMSAINKLAEMPNSAKEMQYLLNMNNHHARFKNFSI